MPAGYDWLIFKLHEFSREPSLSLSAPRLPSAVFLNNLLLRPPYLYHSCSHCFLRLNSRPKSLPFVSQVQVRSNSNVTNDVTWRSHSFERNTPTCGFTASYNAARKMILWMSLASSWHWRVTRWRLSGQNSLADAAYPFLLGGMDSSAYVRPPLFRRRVFSLLRRFFPVTVLLAIPLFRWCSPPPNWKPGRRTKRTFADIVLSWRLFRMFSTSGIIAGSCQQVPNVQRLCSTYFWRRPP